LKQLHGTLLRAVHQAFYAARQSKQGPDAELYAQKKRPLKPDDDAKVTEVLAKYGETVLVTQPTASCRGSVLLHTVALS
jgi:hypothetical protein